MNFEEASTGVTLMAIDKAFGPTADLYLEVLGVKPNATSEQIQRAYLDRRNELFQLLSDLELEEDDSVLASHRFHAERKMDAVVMAMRILGDPELRLQYDDLRHERVQGRMSPTRVTSMDEADISLSHKGPQIRNNMNQENRPHYVGNSPSTASESSGSEMRPIQLDPPTEKRGTSARHSRSSRHESRKGHQRHSRSTATRKEGILKTKTKFAPSTPPAMTDARHEMDDDDQSNTRETRMNVSPDGTAGTQDMDDLGTYASETSTVFTESTMMTQKKGFVQRVRDEVVGVFDDTAMSFHQVFNAFTLSEEDITAVQHRIEKANRQLKRTL